MSPRGAPLTQAKAREWAAGPGLVIFCPRFEGVDERAIVARGLVEISIGDFVLSGGEIAALAVLDACVRLIPGVMGKEASGAEESFESGLLEYPQYTRPREFESLEIPEALLSGDHARIAKWRREQAEKITRARRPDLLKGKPLIFAKREGGAVEGKEAASRVMNDGRRQSEIAGRTRACS
jgi:tRNA (guanine37-N1)-methyltransferase